MKKPQTDDMSVAWPTLGLILACYAMWAMALWVLPPAFAVPTLALVIAFHASLQHEVIHGHPFRQQFWNDILIWPPLTMAVPYARFRATHLAHHNDMTLTDPYDDPETNYLDPLVWEKLPAVARALLAVNNTLAGRLVLGPIIGQVTFMVNEWRMRDLVVSRGWLWHVPAVGCVVAVVDAAPLSLEAYFLACYLALSVLKLRTFLEHQAHTRASGRSVIIEGRSLFAFLFLNNNLHVVHHMHPKVAWYRLPMLYHARRDHYLRRNGGYLYQSYFAVVRQHLWRAKDPVAHPLWRR